MDSGNRNTGDIPERLSLETKTLYVELLEQIAAFEAHRTIGHLSGCFITKTVKGEDYCYFQYSEPGGRMKQIYVGKKDHSLDNLVQRFLDSRKTVKADLRNIERLCAQLRAGGALTAEAAPARILKALADAGFFHLQGVLIGTHAFAVLGNLLGVHWSHASAKTQDIDVAGQPALSVAVPDSKIDLPGILDRLEVGFLPVPQMNLKHPSTSFKVRGKALRVDVLTPEVGRSNNRPVILPYFNAAAQPLRFLDYLIEKTERGAVVNGGGILVNVPHPARFAFHKLIILHERAAAFQTKAEKDLLQAAQLFAVLSEERPGDLMLAWEEIRRRGPGWVKRVLQGLSDLKRRHRVIHSLLMHVLPELAD